MTRACLTLLLLTVFLAGLTLSVPARAQIVVAGPATPTAHALMAWIAAHVPARFGARARFEVRPLSDSEIEQYLKAGDTDSDPDSPAQSAHADDGDIDGIFEDNPPRITLRVPASGSPDMVTFAHEYGHYVWFNVFSKEDRKRYEAVYKKQKAARHLVTFYAQTDAVEGFAEAFSFYVSEPPLLLRRDPLSFQFLCQWSPP